MFFLDTMTFWAASAAGRGGSSGVLEHRGMSHTRTVRPLPFVAELGDASTEGVILFRPPMSSSLR